MSIRFFLSLLIACLSLASSLKANLPDDIASANQSLSSGHPVEALSAYQAVLAAPALSQFSAPELWYNRGLAEEKTGDPLAASLSYRRALLLDPAFLPARTHLATLLATLGVRETKEWKRNAQEKLLSTLHPDLLILSGSILGWLGVLVLVFLLLAGPRRPAFIALSLAAIILGHCLALFCTLIDPRLIAENEAVVMAKTPPVLHETPVDSAKSEGTLAPGSLITILSRNGAWWKVSDSSANTGWIPSTTVTPLLPVSAGL